jgi:hypothetical protein
MDTTVDLKNMPHDTNDILTAGISEKYLEAV